MKALKIPQSTAQQAYRHQNWNAAK